MINRKEIIETIDMVEKEHFDIRTITMGISLLSCIREDAKLTARLCYDKICQKAEKFAAVWLKKVRSKSVPKPVFSAAMNSFITVKSFLCDASRMMSKRSKPVLNAVSVWITSPISSKVMR